MKTDCTIIAHGGAGGINFARRRRSGLIRAVEAGYRLLAQGGSCIDAVEKAGQILEDIKIFNAGTGSSLNLKGEAEMDASIMTSDMAYGAVGAIRNVKNPIHVARLVMERTDHLLLCGDGAIRFARLMGCRYYDPKTREKKRQWANKRRRMASEYFPRLEELTGYYGTIGVVARDCQGKIAAATSSGGITLRLPGRVGDTPVIGAGTYADRNGGASATGHGEAIMRLLLAFRAVSLMARYPASRSGRRIIEFADRHDCRCGLVGVDRRGQILCVNNTRAMSWCYIRHGKIHIFD
jgi:beta-aspartyl-peptidase (threonine type)